MVSSGAEIQIDKGSYTRIHNAILEQLAYCDFTSREYACILYLLRMTYGFSRKEVKLSNGDIAKATGIDPANVSRTMRRLADNKIVIKGDASPNTAAIWQFNKYFEQWTITCRAKKTPDSDKNSCQNSNSSDGDYCQDSNTPIAEIAREVLPIQQENSCQNSNSYISAKESIKDSCKEQHTATNTTTAQFTATYKQVWALVPASEYEVDKITDWAERVTLEAWEYALRESVDSGAVGKWKYLETILKRVERDGLNGKAHKAPAVPAVVDVSKPEVKAWQI